MAVAPPCPHLQEMAACHFHIAMSSGPVDSLQIWSTYRKYSAFLANLVSRCKVRHESEDKTYSQEHYDCIPSSGPLNVPSSITGPIVELIQKPCRALESVRITVNDATGPPILVRNAFLGGSASRLKEIKLDGISFPFSEIRRVLLSAKYLVRLHLSKIPNGVYFSPDDLVTALSTLVLLERLTVNFHSPASRPPISMARRPQRTAFAQSISLSLNEEDAPPSERCFFETSCRRLDWQLSFVTQISTQLSLLLSSVRILNIEKDYSSELPTAEEDVDSAQWLELFQQFSHVRLVSVDVEQLVPGIVRALVMEDAAEEIFPELTSLRLEGFRQSPSMVEAVEQFVTTRRLSGRLVEVYPL